MRFGDDIGFRSRQTHGAVIVGVELRAVAADDNSKRG